VKLSHFQVLVLTLVVTPILIASDPDLLRGRPPFKW
jgi:hypothetical protein